MNPIQSYFDWHDARYLAHAADPRKNRTTIKSLRILRVALFLATVLTLLVLTAAVGLKVFREDLLPEEGVLVPGVLLPQFALSYIWVTEALVFRRYIDSHNNGLRS